MLLKRGGRGGTRWAGDEGPRRKRERERERGRAGQREPRRSSSSPLLFSSSPPAFSPPLHAKHVPHVYARRGGQACLHAQGARLRLPPPARSRRRDARDGESRRLAFSGGCAFGRPRAASPAPFPPFSRIRREVEVIACPAGWRSGPGVAQKGARSAEERDAALPRALDPLSPTLPGPPQRGRPRPRTLSLSIPTCPGGQVATFRPPWPRWQQQRLSLPKASPTSPSFYLHFSLAPS